MPVRAHPGTCLTRPAGASTARMSSPEVPGKTVYTFENISETVNFLLVIFSMFMCTYTDFKSYETIY